MTPAQIAAAAMGHGASQNEAELADVVALIAAAAPAVIVEIGCDTGGTLYAWRQVCSRVYGITTEDNSHASGGSGRPLVTHGAQVITGDSHDWDVLGELVDLLDGDPIDVLVIDGDHRVEGVRLDLVMYGTQVRRDGGLILLHDIGYTSDPRARVHELWPELARQFATSEIRHSGAGFGWGVIYWGRAIHQVDPSQVTSSAQ